eukprot:jgi/Bigna1/79698/fgenesh1_pg.64_\
MFPDSSHLSYPEDERLPSCRWCKVRYIWHVPIGVGHVPGEDPSRSAGHVLLRIFLAISACSPKRRCSSHPLFMTSTPQTLTYCVSYVQYAAFESTAAKGRAQDYASGEGINRANVLCWDQHVRGWGRICDELSSACDKRSRKEASRPPGDIRSTMMSGSSLSELYADAKKMKSTEKEKKDELRRFLDAHQRQQRRQENHAVRRKKTKIVSSSGEFLPTCLLRILDMGMAGEGDDEEHDKDRIVAKDVEAMMPDLPIEEGHEEEDDEINEFVKAIDNIDNELKPEDTKKAQREWQLATGILEPGESMYSQMMMLEDEQEAEGGGQKRDRGYANSDEEFFDSVLWKNTLLDMKKNGSEVEKALAAYYPYYLKNDYKYPCSNLSDDGEFQVITTKMHVAFIDISDPDLRESFKRTWATINQVDCKPLQQALGKGGYLLHKSIRTYSKRLAHARGITNIVEAVALRNKLENEDSTWSEEVDYDRLYEFPEWMGNYTQDTPMHSSAFAEHVDPDPVQNVTEKWGMAVDAKPENDAPYYDSSEEDDDPLVVDAGQWYRYVPLNETLLPVSDEDYMCVQFPRCSDTRDENLYFPILNVHCGKTTLGEFRRRVANFTDFSPDDCILLDQESEELPVESDNKSLLQLGVRPFQVMKLLHRKNLTIPMRELHPEYFDPALARKLQTIKAHQERKRKKEREARFREDDEWRIESPNESDNWQEIDLPPPPNITIEHLEVIERPPIVMLPDLSQPPLPPRILPAPPPPRVKKTGKQGFFCKEEDLKIVTPPPIEPPPPPPISK